MCFVLTPLPPSSPLPHPESSVTQALLIQIIIISKSITHDVTASVFLCCCVCFFCCCCFALFCFLIYYCCCCYCYCCCCCWWWWLWWWWWFCWICCSRSLLISFNTLSLSLFNRFMQHPTRIRKGQRGAKPRCMRNQTPLPIAPSPSSTTPSPRPASSFSPSTQPPDSSKPLSDSKPLDPLHVADEVRRSGLPLSSDSHDVIDSRALLFTPVSSHVQDVSSDSKPNVSLEVKDKRPLSHPKDGIPYVHGSSKPCIKREIFGEKFLGHPYNCDVDMKLFSQLLGPRHQQADGSERYCSPMEVDGQDFQEEPEDLSLKPPRRWAETEVSERCKLDVSPSPETAEISSILS